LKEIQINFNKFKIEDFNFVFKQTQKFIEKNIEKINLIQEKFKNKINLICDPNFQGIKNLIYLANNVELKNRFKKNFFLFSSKKFILISFLILFFSYLIYFYYNYYYNINIINKNINKNKK
jgi:uncharacterized coiled-coil protein SlyX